MTQLTHIQQIMSRKEKCEAAFVETEKGELGNFLQALLFSLWTQVTGFSVKWSFTDRDRSVELLLGVLENNILSLNKGCIF